MATYLIDYENVSKDGLNGITRLTEQDKVIIFYSERADRMTFGLHRRLNETKATVEYKRVEVGGHNALDFQLATYLGFLVAKDSKEEYCVVSNDRGFEYLTGFWRKPLYDVTLTRTISESPQAEERRQARRNGQNGNAGQDGGNRTVTDADDRIVNDPAGGEVTAAGEMAGGVQDGNAVVAVDKMPLIVVPGAEKRQLDIVRGKPGRKKATGKNAAEEDDTSPAKKNESESADAETGKTEPTKKAAAEESGPSVKTEQISENADKKTSPSKRRRTSRSRKRVAIPYLEDVKNLVGGNGLADRDLEEIAGFVERYKTKQGVNNALVRRFGNQKGGELYQGIKPLLKDKKGHVTQKALKE